MISKENENQYLKIILIFIVGILTLCIYFFSYYDHFKNIDMCSDRFGYDYSYWNGVKVDGKYMSDDFMSYEYIDENHFNCCFKSEPILNSNGTYKINKICKGFTR